MRFFWLVLLVLFVAVVVIFAAQNLQTVTVSFLGMSVRVSLALLAVGLYVLGAASGAWLLALVKHLLSKSEAIDLITKRQA
jgi:uncharacterized integral membrane protein